MSMRDIVTRPSRPVVGEIYKVTGMSFSEIDDRFNPGFKRPLLVLHTDKGDIYATTSMAKEAANDPEDAASVLIGSTLEAYEYRSKATNLDCIGLRLKSNS